jgi:hypothetical protein
VVAGWRRQVDVADGILRPRRSKASIEEVYISFWRRGAWRRWEFPGWGWWRLDGYHPADAGPGEKQSSLGSLFLRGDTKIKEPEHLTTLCKEADAEPHDGGGTSWQGGHDGRMESRSCGKASAGEKWAERWSSGGRRARAQGSALTGDADNRLIEGGPAA